jgi:hypothetical protein
MLYPAELRAQSSESGYLASWLTTGFEPKQTGRKSEGRGALEQVPPASQRVAAWAWMRAIFGVVKL